MITKYLSLISWIFLCIFKFNCYIVPDRSKRSCCRLQIIIAISTIFILLFTLFLISTTAHSKHPRYRETTGTKFDLSITDYFQILRDNALLVGESTICNYRYEIKNIYIIHITYHRLIFWEKMWVRWFYIGKPDLDPVVLFHSSIGFHLSPTIRILYL